MKNKFISTRASVLIFWNRDSRKCWVWAIYDITPSIKRADRYRAFTCVLKQGKAVFFSLYNLSGRIYHFFRKSTLYINGFSNSDQFDSICLDHAYQFVESVVTQGKYEYNIHLFNSSNIVCYIGNKRLFLRTNFVRTNKLRIAQPFQYPRNSWCLKAH